MSEACMTFVRWMLRVFAVAAVVVSGAAGVAFAAATLSDVWTAWRFRDVERLCLERTPRCAEEDGRKAASDGAGQCYRWQMTARASPKLEGAPAIECNASTPATAEDLAELFKTAKGTLLPKCESRLGVAP